MRDSAKTIPWNHPNTRCVSIQYKTSLASWCIGVPTTQLALNDFIPDLLLWRWPLFSDASCNGPSYLLAKQKRRFSYIRLENSIQRKNPWNQRLFCDKSTNPRVKAISRKCYFIKGVDIKICQGYGVFTGEGMFWKSQSLATLKSSTI